MSTSLRCLQQTTSTQRGFEPVSAEAHTAQGSSESDGTGARPTSSPESEGGNSGNIERLHGAGGSSIDGESLAWLRPAGSSTEEQTQGGLAPKVPPSVICTI